MSVRGDRPSVLLSTVSSDSHTWNLVYLGLLLEENGYQVISLGACVPDDLLLARVRRHEPDAIVISSVNGHGGIDGARLVRQLRADPATAGIPAVIGGKLGIAGQDAGQRQELLSAGFDAVFGDEDPVVLLHALAELIETRQAAGHHRVGVAV